MGPLTMPRRKRGRFEDGHKGRADGRAFEALDLNALATVSDRFVMGFRRVRLIRFQSKRLVFG